MGNSPNFVHSNWPDPFTDYYIPDDNIAVLLRSQRLQSQQSSDLSLTVTNRS